MKTMTSPRGMMLAFCVCCIPLLSTIPNTDAKVSEFFKHSKEWNPKLWKASKLLSDEVYKLGKDDKVKRKALMDMRDYIEYNRDNDDVLGVLSKAMVYAVLEAEPEEGGGKKAIIGYLYGVYSRITTKVQKISTLKATGLDRTTGHIADLTVENPGNTAIRLEPQTFYIPGSNLYQSYIGRIGDNIYLPPNCTVTIPIHGYCADPFKPPVPYGAAMPDFDKWIPALEVPADYSSITSQISIVNDEIETYGPPPQVPEPMNPPGEGDDPQVPEPMNPPGEGDDPQVPEPMNPPGEGDDPQVPEPMNPPGEGDDPQVPEPMNPPGEGDDPQVPEPMNPPKGKNTPPDFENVIPPADPVIRLSYREPLPPFNPLVLPEEDKEGIQMLTGEDYYPTYPGTDVRIKTKIEVEADPETYVPIIVAALKEIKESAVTVQENPNFDTPFSPDEEKELEAFTQQPFWIFMSLVTDGDYNEDTNKENVQNQFEKVTGVTYEDLDDDERENLVTGTKSFWTAYTAVGLEAKVFSADSPEIDDSVPGMSEVLASVSSPGCDCDSITYDLTVKRGVVVVYSGSHNARHSPSIKVEDLEYGDKLEVKLYNINAHCMCDDGECEFYKPQSDNKSSSGYIKTDTSKPGKVEIRMDNDNAQTISDNCNCQNSDKSWNSEEDEYSFELQTRDEGTKENAIFQRMTIRAYCELEDCRRKLCKKRVQLNFVKK